MPLTDTTNDLRSLLDVSNSSFKLPLSVAYSLRSGDRARASIIPRSNNREFKTPNRPSISAECAKPIRRLNRSFNTLPSGVNRRQKRDSRSLERTIGQSRNTSATLQRPIRVSRSSDQINLHSLDAAESLNYSNRLNSSLCISSSSINLPPIQGGHSLRRSRRANKSFTDHSSNLSLLGSQFNISSASINLPPFYEETVSEQGGLFKTPYDVTDEGPDCFTFKRKDGSFIDLLNLSFSSLSSFNIDGSFHDAIPLTEIDGSDLFFSSTKTDEDVPTKPIPIDQLHDGIKCERVPVVLLERLNLPHAGSVYVEMAPLQEDLKVNSTCVESVVLLERLNLPHTDSVYLEMAPLQEDPEVDSTLEESVVLLERLNLPHTGSVYVEMAPLQEDPKVDSTCVESVVLLERLNLPHTGSDNVEIAPPQEDPKVDSTLVESVVLLDRLNLPHTGSVNVEIAPPQEDPKVDSTRVGCVACCRDYKHKSILSKHITQKCYTEMRLHCPKCSKAYVQKKSLESHKKLLCGTKWAPSYVCSKCKRLDHSRLALKKHKQFNCSFKCKTCKKSFKYYRGLDSHMKRNSCKAMKCSDCFRYYQTVDDLQQHSKSCTKIPEFQCKKCGLHYRYKRGLDRHLRMGCVLPKEKENEESEEKPYQCARCPKNYRRKEELERHARLECGNKRCFSCSQCPYESHHKHHLVRHISTVHDKILGKSWGWKMLK